MTENLRRDVLRGLRWVAGGRIAAQIFTWLSTLVVIRLLEPADYGLMTLATIFIGFLKLFSELGLAPAVIQAKEIRQDQLQDVFGTILLLNFSITTILFTAAPSVSAFFDEPMLSEVLRLLSLQFLLNSFGVLPEALLRRRMEFRGLSLWRLVAAVCSSVLTIVLAWKGYGVWSLVWGNLLNFGLRSAFATLILRWIPIPRLRIRNVVHLVHFGGLVSVAGILDMVSRRADSFIIGKALGKESLGFYSVGLHLAWLPMERVSEVLNQVSLPAFSRIQSDPSLSAQQFLKASRIGTFFAVPVSWGMASVAPEAIPLILGSQWTMAILPFQIVCLVMPLRIVATVLEPMLQGGGYAKLTLMNACRTLGVMIIAFLVGSRAGIVGVSLAWLLAWPLVFNFNLGRSLPMLNLSRRDLIAALSRSWIAGLAMIIIVSGLRLSLSSTVGEMATLVTCIMAGALGYAIAVVLINKEGMSEAVDLLRNR